MNEWPRHEREVVPWRQQFRGGVREDRELREVTVWLPPRIADVTLNLSAGLVQTMELAVREVTLRDRDSDHLAALGVLLLRSESVASSKIEAISASLEDYGRALGGRRDNTSARAMVDAGRALEQLLATVKDGRDIELPALLRGHQALMESDPGERDRAGRLREVQNWIGGSDYSPRNALYVPPPPESVPDYMADLLAFTRRTDLPALAQAFIAHAQFESIHPFVDGNGRIGRALINMVLRRRGLTSRIALPLATYLVADRERYFDALTRFRNGELEHLMALFTHSATVVAIQARTTTARLQDIQDEWWDLLAPVRRGSAVAALLSVLAANPIMTSETAQELTGSTRSSVHQAIARAAAVGVLSDLTPERQRNKIWAAGAVLAEGEDLALRIGDTARAQG